MAEQKKSSAKAMILPPLVLAVICAVCCAFLALANMVTKDKIAAAEADAPSSPAYSSCRMPEPLKRSPILPRRTTKRRLPPDCTRMKRDSSPCWSTQTAITKAVSRL